MTDRDQYGWESVERDLALSTPLTMPAASEFSRAYMEQTGVHPYDLVQWVATFYSGFAVSDVPARAVRELVSSAFRSGAAFTTNTTINVNVSGGINEP